MHNRKKLSLLIVSIFLTLGASLTSVFAWYTGKNATLDQSNLGGSLLKGYFHCGDGSSSTYTYDSETGEVLSGPFTITTPIHYENLVKLHYNVPGFSEKEYHFAFGFPLLSSSDPVFYATENGVVDVTDTSKTLDLGGMTLPPLGTSDNPFFGHIEGNGLSISNFTVTGKDSEGDGYCDIGVFGYVGSQTEDDDTTLATINNCYWSNFTIDTTGGKCQPSTFKHESGSVHEHPDMIHMGYLAGHVVYGASFTDCYVNDCHLKGGTNTDIGVNNYGYFGKVEIDALGGKTGKGNDYEFTLNSQACYNYFNTNYASIQNDYLVTRNTREAENSDESFVDENGDTVFETDRTVSTAITRNSNSRYTINDGYSLSKTGFTEPEFIEETHNFNAYYDANHYTSYGEDGNETTISLGDGINKAIPSVAPVDSGRSLKDEKDGLIQWDDGEWHPSEYYYKKNTNEWYYGISYNRNIDPTIDYVDTFTINITMSTYTAATISRPTVSTLRGTLYVDDYEPIPLTIKSNITGSFLNYKVAFTVTPVTFEYFQYGMHYISVFVELGYSGWADHDAKFFYGSAQTVGEDYILYQNQELINHEGQISKTISFDTSRSQTNNVPNVYDQQPYSAEVGLVDERTREYPIYFYEYTIDDETGNKIESESYCTNTSILEQFTNLDLVYTNYSWYISKTLKIQVQGGENENYFISERPQLVDSGYSYKNIDITGGSEIYYRQIPILGSVSIISLPSERTAGQVVAAPPSKGSHFYAEEACQGCVVLFIKNTVNAADTRDEDLGHIVFTYVEINIGSWGLELVDPVFKKGNAFMDLEDSGEAVNPPSNPDNLTKQIDINLKESDVQKVSYCCLDEKGNILGSYATDGTTSMTSKEIAKIDTYVLAIGGYSTSGSDAWVTNIDFSYKAEEGYGGTFGSVGYRSSPDTLETTILNIHFTSPENNVYELYVNFDKSTNTYTITFISDLAISANVFNYQNDTYTIIFNGETHTESFFNGSSVSP